MSPTELFLSINGGGILTSTGQELWYFHSPYIFMCMCKFAHFFAPFLKSLHLTNLTCLSYLNWLY